MKILTRLALACTFALLAATSAHAQTGTPQDPFVITGPATITQSGYYILGNNINFSATTGNIITVNASNVTIDFNNFYIAGPVNNTATQVFGINANERSNLTIKNGTIAYCYYGIYITGNNSATTNNVGHRIDTMRVTYCTAVGIEVYYAPSSVISNCQVSKVTGSTAGSGLGSGIICAGDGLTVADCSVADITSSGGNYGIYLGSGAFAVRNRISNALYGIYCPGSAKYQNNLTLSCSVAFGNGTDAGNNN